MTVTLSFKNGNIRTFSDAA